ncbi:MAG: iron ABC transporter substrate-binding protein [Chlamydiae bacterium]|nr:MAG: iron ABC transporter substrate-binding protein [Chlamydiota bacterium]
MKKFIIVVICVITVGFFWFKNKESGTSSTVIVYVSEDQVFSEPVLNAFEKVTGIKVKAVYDTEESKSTGAMNRLIAEKNNPQADVYWANEPIRAEVLKQRGISAPYFSKNAAGIPDNFKDSKGYWTGFSARARVLVVNKKVKKKPASIIAYTEPQWKGKAVIANPLFGTTTTQISALFTIWGDTRAKDFMNKVKENKTKISSSNGESADLVASGEFDFSLVDSDDAINRSRQGKPIEMIYPDQGKNEIGCLIVPNAAVLINGAPHIANAKKLIDYLLSKQTEKKLAFADCAQIPLHTGVDTPKELKNIEQLKTMKINYGEVALELQKIQPFLKSWVGY